MLITGRHTKHMQIMSKSARTKHKNENFYAYENVMMLLNIVHRYFFRFCRIYAIIAIKNDFVIHEHSLGPSGSVENLGLHPRWKIVFSVIIGLTQAKRFSYITFQVVCYFSSSVSLVGFCENLHGSAGSVVEYQSRYTLSQTF